MQHEAVLLMALSGGAFGNQGVNREIGAHTTGGLDHQGPSVPRPGLQVCGDFRIHGDPHGPWITRRKSLIPSGTARGTLHILRTHPAYQVVMDGMPISQMRKQRLNAQAGFKPRSSSEPTPIRPILLGFL